MKKIILLVLLVLILIFAANTTQADFKTQAGEKLTLSNPKNIEVVCTVINLTDYWEKRHTDFPFAAEVREKFLPYQDHPAVKMTADLMKKGWWQIHFFNIALGITPLPEGRPEMEGEPESKSKWFGMEPVKEYISALRDFYRDSGYGKFWKKNQGFYHALQDSLAQRYKKKETPLVEIMEDFYGLEFDEYHMVPAVQLVDMGIHVEVNKKNKREAYYFNGPLGKDKADKEGDYFAPVSALIYNAFHEFGHSFLEPILMENQDLLKEYSYIHEKAKEGMAQKGYQSWDRIFIENLIHAVQICLIEKAWSPETAEKMLEREYENGYFLIKDMHQILQDYQKNREKYRSFQKFMPVIFKKLGEKYRRN